MRQLPAAQDRSAAPFPPIADYALPVRLRDDGAGRAERQRRVDVPAAHGLAERLRRDPRPRRRRRSGSARPTSRCRPRAATCPGTMVLETSWGTRGGWIIVRDVLLIGPWHHEDERSHTHRRAPTDYDADHVLLRTVRCVNGEVQIVARLRAGVRLRPRARPRGSTPATATTRARAAPGRRPRAAPDRPTCNLGFEGPRATARHADEGGRDALLRAVVERAPGAARPTRRPTSGWSGPPTTGSTGSTAASSPTTRGAPTCSAAR